MPTHLQTPLHAKLSINEQRAVSRSTSYYPELKLGGSLVSPSTKTPQLSPSGANMKQTNTSRETRCVEGWGRGGGVPSFDVE